MSRASGDRAGAASDPNNGSLVLVSVKWKFKLVILEPSGLCRLRGYDGSCNLAGYLETLCASLTALCEVITFRTPDQSVQRPASRVRIAAAPARRG